ncbi:hypothetical protein [Sphingomonas sp.]|uniref:hypothetical protein n=1 Tax=Sphingomonas sp. TaxID=28214 RepID=UPI003750E37B
MSGFSPAERTAVDDHYRQLVKGLHDLGVDWARRLREILQRAEYPPNDPTLARVLVASELLRGIAADGRSPLTIRGYALPASLSGALTDAERLGRDLGPHVHAARRGLLSFLSKPPQRLSQEAREALMRCRMIGVQFERRAAQPGRSVKTR